MMDFKAKLQEVQASLQEEEIDGWLLFDFRRSNPLVYTFLNLASDKMLTRRFFYWIPQKGDPVKIVSMVEPYVLDHLPGSKWIYRGWQELERLLFSIGTENRIIAMEYSPYNALPTASNVDAGTLELVRKSGVEVVSSANILQRYTSIWTVEQLKSHLAAAKVLESIVDQTWAFIEHSLQVGVPLNEYQVQQFMLQAILEKGCQTDHLPHCAINANSANPHYDPQPDQSLPIRAGDFILLDLWCKQKVPHAVYADITRVGVAAPRPTSKQQEVFQIVKKARDQATLFIKEHYENSRSLQGWQVDQICRNFIEKTGYSEYFIHRTGHNLGEEVHGPGANLDNFETHDYRQLLAGTGFTIEPGIYLPGEFGIRLEYDIYLDPVGKICITGGIQEELVCLQV